MKKEIKGIIFAAMVVSATASQLEAGLGSVNIELQEALLFNELAKKLLGSVKESYSSVKESHERKKIEKETQKREKLEAENYTWYTPLLQYIQSLTPQEKAERAEKTHNILYNWWHGINPQKTSPEQQERKLREKALAQQEALRREQQYVPQFQPQYPLQYPPQYAPWHYQPHHPPHYYQPHYLPQQYPTHY